MVKRFLIFATLGILFFSCIKDEPIPELVDDGTVMFVGEDYQPATKTTLNGLQTEWVANTDKVGLFSPQASKTIGGVPGVVNEPLTALSSGARSQFSGSVYWNTGEHTFYSYYPYAAGTPPHTAVPVSLPADQTQSAGNNINHLSALDFLIAKPHTVKYPGFSGAPATVSLRYNHLFSIIEFQIIRNSGSGTITKVQLRGRVPLAFGSGTVNLTQNTPNSGVSYVIDGMTNTSNSVTVSLTSAVTPTNSYETTPKVYMVVLPGVHIGEVKIALESGGIFREVKKSDVTFERGKKYIIKVDAAQAIVPFIKGSDLEPVTIGNLIWAPVNVGYRSGLEYGLLFQWSRKNGFEGLVTDPILQSKPLLQSDLDQETAYDRYRNYYLTTGEIPNDWMPVKQSEWNMSNRFNPCPEGWRLPTKAEFDGLIALGHTLVTGVAGGVDNIAGRWFGPNHSNPDLRTSSAIFLPYTGATGNGGGARSTITNAYYWTTSVGGTNNRDGVSLYFTNSNVYSTVRERASSSAVRCVKDLFPSDKPVIRTIKPFNVKHNSAKTGVYIESAGGYPIVERGIVYNTGTTVDPTGNKRIASSGGPNEYVVEMTGLTASSSYIVRSYVINSLSQTFYGDQYRLVTTPNWDSMDEVVIGGITWAPVNSGYSTTLPYGLLYQWSRIYGQGYDLIETPTFVTATPSDISTVNNVGNANKFYKPTSSPYDCLTARATTWSPTYNPCPIGWRVPSKAEFEILIASGSTWVASGVNGKPGRWFGGNHATDKVGSLFLPAAGIRGYDSGAGLRNEWGGYWTETPDGNFANALFFTETISPYIEGGRYRAGGHSIRCVK